MDLISWFILLFTGARLLITFYNRISFPFLPEPDPEVDLSDLSILIPARNEESNLSLLLDELQKLNTVPSDIWIYDDISTDRTAEIAESFSSKCPTIHLLKGTDLPAGWLGKNYACYSLAQKAKGRYFLFLDADVRVSPDFPRKILSYAKKNQLKLVSIFPRQQMNHFSTRLSVPLMNWILLSLLPLSLVRRSSFVSLAAANGQCMLFEKEIYETFQPHQRVRKNPVEDMGIMKLYKHKKIPVAVLLGCHDISCQMYHGLKDSIAGFSKNIFQFFGGNILLAFLFAVITTFGLPWLFINVGWLVASCFLGILILIRLFVSLSSCQNSILNILLMFPQQIVFWLLLVSALIRKLKNKNVWKERNISV